MGIQKKDEGRCGTCGKVIESGQYFEMRKGKVTPAKGRAKAKFVDKGSWAHFHHECLARSVSSPQLVDEQLRQQAQGRAG